MIIVVVIGVSVIYCIIDMLVKMCPTTITTHKNEDTSYTSIIILDILIVLFMTGAGGGFGFLMSILVCTVIDIILANSCREVKDPKEIYRIKQKMKNEQIDYDRNGFIDWENK